MKTPQLGTIPVSKPSDHEHEDEADSISDLSFAPVPHIISITSSINQSIKSSSSDSFDSSITGSTLRLLI